MKIKSLLLILASAALVFSCKKEVTPTPSGETVKFVNKTLDIAKTGETKLAGIQAITDWTISCDAQWVAISPLSGTIATTNITVTVATENASEDPRTATVTITDAHNPEIYDTMIITQKSAAGFNGKITSVDSFMEFCEVAGDLTESDEVTMEADINLEGKALTPITSFAGKLDGKGHKLYNFTVTSNTSLAGVFLTNNGTIKDIVIGSADGKSWDKTTVIKFVDDITGVAAGVVATNNGTMQKVVNFASVNFNANAEADAAAGGVAGCFGGPDAKLLECENNGSIAFSGISTGRVHLGGVLGVNGAQTNALVEDCVNNGSVIKANINQKEFTMGGVVARSNVAMVIRRCVNTGLVSYEATETPGTYIHIAGVLGAGYYGVTLEECVNKGEVSSVCNQVNRCGGVAGTLNTGGTVTACRNEGKVGINNPGNANWQAIGGIVGFEEKAASEEQKILIKDCKNTGEVYAIVNNSTTHANKVAVGGIAGTACSAFLIMENNENSGKVWGTNEGGIDLYAGGIAGWYLKGAGFKTKGNKNSGEVSVVANAGAAGGIIGNSSIKASTHEAEENTGNVVCSVASATGAIAGLNAASIATCSIQGTVNGTEVNSGNFASLIQGSASSGTTSGCYYGGSGPVDYVNVTPASLSFKSAGETLSMAVSSNCAWTVTSDKQWLTLSVAEGTTETTEVTATAAENEASSERTATITFTSKTDATKTTTVAVTQAKHTGALEDNKINNLTDLQAFIALAADATAETTYTVEADVDCGGATLAAITSFAGVLDGKNHVIKNFKITTNGTSTGFVLVNTGTVKDLTFGAAGVESTIEFAEGVSAAEAAAVIAVNKGTVQNVTNYASVNFNATSGAKDASAAGVVGQVSGESAVVKACKNYGKVTMSCTMSDRAAIAGTVGTITVAGATVEDCHNYATITYSRKNEKELAVAGTVARSNVAATIKGCTNNAPVEYTYNEGAPGSYMHIGGVIAAAYNGAEINGCTNNGKVSSCIQQTLRAGGVIATVNTGGKVIDCVNKGEVVFTQAELTSKTWFGIGGICGFEEKSSDSAPLEISGCTNEGAVNVSMAHTNNGHVNRIGVAGILGSGSTIDNLSGNTNKGTVTVKNTGETTAYAGGITGFLKSASRLTSSNNTNTADIKLEATDGAAGGVHGNVASSVAYKSDTNTGSVSFSSDSANAKTGSIAGLCAGVLTECKVGGVVNGTTLTAENFSSYIAGSNSTGSASDCTFATK